MPNSPLKKCATGSASAVCGVKSNGIPHWQSQWHPKFSQKRHFQQAAKVAALFCLAVLSQTVIAGVNVIPLPNSVKLLDGDDFVFNKATQIVADKNLQPVAKMLNAFLSPAFGFHLSLSTDNPTNNVVILKLNDQLDLGDEGYRLKTDSNGVLIEANKAAGIFYGIQTLRQLLPAEVFNEYEMNGKDESVWRAPSVEIVDAPQFGWRGQHLDVSRHFFPLDFLKKYIDLMAIHKINKFHIHFTDDQGWRLEIKKYPKLTEIGAWRDKTLVTWPRSPNVFYEIRRYGGYYTQQQIRELVQYAQDRFIEIIPEIEMPSHSRAAINSYPRLTCDNKMCRDYCPGKEEVFQFHEDVLTEVMDLFPSKYIHIGGDEAKKSNWKTCPKCQARMAAEGLKDIDELQSYFVKRIEKFLTKHNRKLIGWDEISLGGLPPNATVMCRFDEKAALKVIKQRHDVIMNDSHFSYFDYCQADHRIEPLAFGSRVVSLDKVYSYRPAPAGLTDQEKKHILGVQACLWTEFVFTPEKAEYMTYPRLCALSEVAWTEPQKKNYDNFLARLKEHFQRFDYYGVNFRRLDK